MIEILGIRRVLILMCLMALNAALGASVYLFLTPQRLQKEMELADLKGRVSTVQGDIDRMLVDFEKLTERQAEYEQLKKQGFFYNQSRRRAEIIFEEISKKAGVISANAKIDAGVVEENSEAVKAEHNVLSSHIKVHVESMDTRSVYNYIRLLMTDFPGHLTIYDIHLERKIDITGVVLRGIASGDNPPLVGADIDLVWRTMVPQSEIIQTNTP